MIEIILNKSTSMLIGYARVSTVDQSLELQLNALKDAGCEKVFMETTSGATSERQSNRPLFEWPGSPVIYSETGETTAKLRDLIPLHFKPLRAYHHYRSIAQKIYKSEWTSDQIRA